MVPLTQRENIPSPAIGRCLFFVPLVRKIDPRDFQKVTRDEISSKKKKEQNIVNTLAERNIVPPPLFKGLRLPISNPLIFPSTFPPAQSVDQINVDGNTWEKGGILGSVHLE